MSDNVPQDKVINLVSSDDRKFKVSLKVIRQSGTITTMIANLAEGEDTIKIDDVNGDTLEKVLTFHEHHVDSPPFSKTDDVCSFDAQFFKFDLGTLNSLIMAAHSLNIERLNGMTCQDLVNRLKGKTKEEMGHMLGLKNDFIPEEAERVWRENAWAEDSD